MTSKTVLIMDADTETEQLITSALESEGHLVFAVPGGDVGVEMAQRVSPSLIFINLEEMGLAICETIRRIEPLKKVPLILLVSPASKIDPAACAAIPGVDILHVPCTSAKLFEMTAKVLDTKAPIVLHVKEKKPEPRIEETGEPKHLEDLVMQQASALETGIPEMSGTSETKEGPQAGSFSEEEKSPKASEIHISREVSRHRKKKSNALVFFAGIAIIIVCVGAVLFFGPGLGSRKTASIKPSAVVVKPKAEVPAQPVQPPASLDEQSKPQAAAENKDLPVTAGKTASALPPVTPPAPAPEKPSPSSDSAPATSAASKHTGRAVYSVQLGVFRNEANANALTKKFAGKGYDAFIVKSTDKDKRTLYRVLIGKSGDRKESAKLAAEVRDKENIKAVIYSGQESRP